MQKLNKEKTKQLINRVWELNKWKIQKFQEDIILDDSNRIIINKARGIGVSLALAFKVILCAATQKGEYILVSQDKDNSEHMLKYIQDFYEILSSSPLEFPRVTYYGKDYYALKNGSQIYSKSSEPNGVRGLHGMVAWDEAAFTPNDAEMRKAINGCLRPNYPLIMFSTPNEMRGVFFDTWDKGDKECWKKYEIPWTENFAPGYRESVERDKKQAMEEGWYDDWLQEYMCKFIDQSTRLFSWPFIVSHVEKNRPQGLKIEYGGLDFGKKIDQSIFHGVGKDAADVIHILQTMEFDLGQEYSVQLEAIRTLLYESKTFCGLYADATGVGVKLIEDLKNTDIGYLTNGITFTQAVKEKMVMYLYSMMTSEKILLPNDKKLLKQMHSIRRTKTDTGLFRYKHEDGKHDDSFWALCLALNGYIDKGNDITTQQIKMTGKSSFTDYRKAITRSRRKRDLWNS